MSNAIVVVAFVTRSFLLCPSPYSSFSGSAYLSGIDFHELRMISKNYTVANAGDLFGDLFLFKNV